MEYAYAALMLQETGAEINERNLKAVLTAAEADVIESRVKALVAALEDVDVGEVAETGPPVPAGDAAGGGPEAPAVTDSGGVESDDGGLFTELLSGTDADEGSAGGADDAGEPGDAAARNGAGGPGDGAARDGTGGPGDGAARDGVGDEGS